MPRNKRSFEMDEMMPSSQAASSRQLMSTEDDLDQEMGASKAKGAMGLVSAAGDASQKAADLLHGKGEEMKEWGKENRDTLLGVMSYLFGGCMQMAGAIASGGKSISRGIANIAKNSAARKEMNPAEKQRNSVEMAGKFFKGFAGGLTKFASAIPLIGPIAGKVLGGLFKAVEKAVKAIDKAVQKGQAKKLEDGSDNDTPSLGSP